MVVLQAILFHQWRDADDHITSTSCDVADTELLSDDEDPSTGGLAKDSSSLDALSGDSGNQSKLLILLLNCETRQVRVFISMS